MKTKINPCVQQFCSPYTPLPNGNSARWVPSWGVRGCAAGFYFNYFFYKTVVRTTNPVVPMLLIWFLTLASCDDSSKEENPQPGGTFIPSPSYFPQLIIPSDNPLTKEGIELGRKLYYDTILSNDGRSCSSCHIQSYSFSNPAVNSLPHINLAWNNKFLWNGSVEGSLEDIMAFEVNSFFATDVSKLNNNPTYPALFQKTFQASPITAQQVAYALAQFIRTQASVNSKFDKYLRNQSLLSPSEWNGYKIFNTEKGDCYHCHSIGLFQDNAFHNNGLDSVFSGADRGRYEVTGNKEDMGKFKTPTLRNVELTAPYMHDGCYATLEEVMEHYNSGVKHSATVDPIFSRPNRLFRLNLNAQEKADLVAFLKSLTDTDFINNPELKLP